LVKNVAYVENIGEKKNVSRKEGWETSCMRPKETAKVAVKWILKVKLCYEFHHIQDRGQAVGSCVMLMNTRNPGNE
jgi:hypothetical protein